MPDAPEKISSAFQQGRRIEQTAKQKRRRNKIMLSHFITGKSNAIVTAVVALGIALPSVSTRAQNHDEDEDHEQTILQFSTVGDSRQDPVSPDPTRSEERRVGKEC